MLASGQKSLNLAEIVTGALNDHKAGRLDEALVQYEQALNAMPVTDATRGTKV
jgi:hypothetical protein